MNLKGEIKLSLQMLVIFAVIGGLAYYVGSNKAPTSAAPISTPTTGGQVAAPIIQIQDDGCPTTKLTAVAFNMYNALNETADNYDVTLRLYDKNSQAWVTTLTDTTSPSTTNLQCNKEFEGRVLYVDGTQNDNSIIHSAQVDAGSVSVINDAVRGSAVQFKTQGGTQTFTLQGERAGVLQFRVRDNNLQALMYSGDDASNSDFEGTAANFSSTTDNVTYTAISSGTYLDFTAEFQATTSYANFVDQGAYATIDRSTTTWNKCSATLSTTQNGNAIALQDYKQLGKLSSGEQQLFSNWEDVYFIPAGDYSTENSGFLRIRCQANAEPTWQAADADNINVRFYSIGNFLSKDGFTLMKGAATDANTAVAVSTLQRFFISIS